MKVGSKFRGTLIAGSGVFLKRVQENLPHGCRDPWVEASYKCERGARHTRVDLTKGTLPVSI